MTDPQIIDRDTAIALAETRFWEDMTPRQITAFQLEVECLCMPFAVFHQATEAALGRPVWTHEFANPDALRAELRGDTMAPTMTEIIDLIPAHKRIIVGLDGAA